MTLFGGDISKLSAEEQKVVQALMDRIDAVETKTAADVQAVADKVIAGLAPMIERAAGAIDTVTLTINASVVEITALARRVDGASMKFALGPEVPDNPEPSMRVTG